jgi:hypothetical protein
MIESWFSRVSNRPSRPSVCSTHRRSRLSVEALEDRMLMNNRFVVPGMVNNVTTFASLHDALTAPGLNAGDIIQIEPNSSPGQLVDADVPAVRNLTIQGDPAFGVQSIPYLTVGDEVEIGPAQQGFTLKNVQVDVQTGDFYFTADGTITGSRIKNDYDNTPIYLRGTNAAVISNSYVENANPQDQYDLLKVEPANGSHNRITDNTFVALTGTEFSLVHYSGGTGTTDVVAHNAFIGNTGDSPLLNIYGTRGLTVESNTFTDYYQNGPAAIGAFAAQNLQILDNAISVPNIGDSTGEGIFVGAGNQSEPTSIVIANNHIHSGGKGWGIEFVAGLPGYSFVARVEGNDLQGNYVGVEIEKGQGGSVAGIDLGLGPQNGLGTNDFRGDFPLAIDVAAFAAAGPIGAFMNIFGVADPSTVINDHNNDPTLASVVSSDPLTINAAYVETLYLDLLHRTGNLSDPKDAGGWVIKLGQGLPAAAVASLVARSPEALGVAVDGFYHRYLGRDADQVGRANFVSYLENGGTLEGVSRAMLASPEYQSRFPTDSSYVQSLYQNLLNRTGSSAEVNSWLSQLPQLGRAGVAPGFLSSPEFRTDEANNDYTWFLHRTGSSADVNSWVSSGKDLLTIDSLFAASLEFQSNG